VAVRSTINVTLSQARALWAMIQYLPANPVRRGLVPGPGAWRWCSAAWYDGRRDVPLRIDDTIL